MSKIVESSAEEKTKLLEQIFIIKNRYVRQSGPIAERILALCDEKTELILKSIV